MEKNGPFILRFGKSRRNEQPLPGSYSTNLDMTVIETEEGEVPLIDTACNIAELKTKTKAVDREGEDLTGMSLPELLTKTNIEREKEDKSLDLFLEMFTKTEVKREEDESA